MRTSLFRGLQFVNELVARTNLSINFRSINFVCGHADFVTSSLCQKYRNLLHGENCILFFIAILIRAKIVLRRSRAHATHKHYQYFIVFYLVFFFSFNLLDYPPSFSRSRKNLYCIFHLSVSRRLPFRTSSAEKTQKI